MKVSLNWVKQFTDLDIAVDELVTKLGAQLGAVEEVVNAGTKYQGIVVVRVVSCEKHPDADKLHVCKVDDGGKVPGVERDENGNVQVVCGAPNVREGLLAAWLPPGATVPSSPAAEPFVLEARQIRGQVSNGMLASSHELAITDDHTGILEVDLDVMPGADFAEAYELNDYIIDIENKMFTHRPDCFGILGVAREIAGITGNQFTSPEWYANSLGRLQVGSEKLPLDVRNEAGDLVPRFMAVTMSGVQVKPSTFIIQTYLARVGVRPINNIVDVTNYLMLLTGQPLHAYDYDKVQALSGGEGAVVLARPSVAGEKLSLLNGKKITLQEGATVIATDTTAIGIAGVMGGADTEVGPETKNIILECANFDMYAVRRTSMAYGLFTDAVTRFNKGQSSEQNDQVIEEAAVTVQYLTGGHLASDFIDVYTSAYAREAIDITSGFVNSRLGLDLSAEEMAKTLGLVEFPVEVNGENLKIMAPFWRTDIQIREDIVEEIGRLTGYDKLPLSLPSRSIGPGVRNPTLDFKTKIRNLLASFGANEVLTYSFVHGDLLDIAGQDKSDAYALSNALSPSLQYYRLSLVPSLLSHVYPNLRAGHERFYIYEINKSHSKSITEPEDTALPKEIETLALVFASKSSEGGAAFYHARHALDLLSARLGMSFRYSPMEDAAEIKHMASPYDWERAAVVYDDASGTRLGIVGEFKPSVRRALKLPVHSAGFELGLEELRLSAKPQAYRALSRFPSVVQDMSLKVPDDLKYAAARQSLKQALASLVEDDILVDVETVDIYQKDHDRHLTFRFTVSHIQKTLRAQEVNQLLDEVAARMAEDIKSERI